MRRLIAAPTALVVVNAPRHRSTRPADETKKAGLTCEDLRAKNGGVPPRNAGNHYESDFKSLAWMEDPSSPRAQLFHAVHKAKGLDRLRLRAQEFAFRHGWRKDFAARAVGIGFVALVCTVDLGSLRPLQ